MLKPQTTAFLKNLAEKYADADITTSQIADERKAWNADAGADEYVSTEIFLVKKKLNLPGRSLNPSRALQELNSPSVSSQPVVVPHPARQPKPAAEEENNGLKSIFGAAPQVPTKFNGFVTYGCFTNVKKVMNSGLPMTVWITGERGYGKTLSITQAAAVCGQRLAKISITSETTKDDLVGGLRIVNGDTVFQKSSLIWAMEHGCPVLIDEVDLGGNRLMALQGVLDHSGILIDKTGEFIKPKAGFQVYMTSNTRGGGDTTGKYAHTQVMNSAFIDRVDTLLTHDAPTLAQEEKILNGVVQSLGVDVSATDCQNIATWASRIRENVKQGLLTEEISTRALTKVVKNMAVFGGSVLHNIGYVVSKSEDEEWVESIKLFWNEIVSAETPEENGPEEDIAF